jgi:hypothetical protein
MVKRAAKTKRKAKGGSSYNPQTGRLTHRAVGAQKRLDDLAEEYIAQGIPADQARQRARMEMRDNPKKRTGAGGRSRKGVCYPICYPIR